MMPSDWIRPDGCEGGSCVEYRTADGKVFVRNSTDEDHMVALTVAEWDAFVAGLTAAAVAEIENRLAAYERLIGLAKVWHNALDEAITALATKGTTP